MPDAVCPTNFSLSKVPPSGCFHCLDKLKFVGRVGRAGRQIQNESSLCYPTASFLWKKTQHTYKMIVPIVVR